MESPEGPFDFALTRIIRDSPDVLICRLVDRKVTYIHRRMSELKIGPIAPQAFAITPQAFAIMPQAFAIMPQAFANYAEGVR